MRINQFLLSIFYSNKSLTPPKTSSTPGLPLENQTPHHVWDTLSIGDETANWTGIYNRQGYPVNAKNTGDGAENHGGVAEYRVKTAQELWEETPDHLKYNGPLSAEEIAEKWATTGEITAPEKNYLYRVNAPLSLEAGQKSQVARVAKQIDQALQAGGITMKADEALTIRVDGKNQITVDGIADPERSAKIQAALQSYTLKFEYSSASLAIGIRGAYFNNSPKTNTLSAEMRSYMLANLTASNFLYNETDGNVTLDDLTVVGGKIAGLPPKLSDLLNGDQLKGVIRNGQNLAGVNTCIQQIKAYQTKYGPENLPSLTSAFTYQNGKLTLVEEPG